MTRHVLFAELEGPEVQAAYDAVSRWPAFERAPDWLVVDDRRLNEFGAWRSEVGDVRESGGVLWDSAVHENGTMRIVLKRRSKYLEASLLIEVPSAFETAADVLRMLADVPFKICRFGSIWPRDWQAADDAPGQLQGWGRAFRGAGHERLVSRRWLEHGPWLLHRAPGDLSLVQYHDFEAAPLEALAQARLAHEMLGTGEDSGMLRWGKPFTPAPDMLYDRAARLYEVVVAGREVPIGEMFTVCMLRQRRRNHPTDPVDRVAYVFLTDAAALAHRHELWLRELECWSVEGGIKRRLDLDYAPPAPPPPAWAARVTS
jgi:hypothetical protein